METAGIKEIKNNLSRYLARVKAGEEILITERGRPIARIIKAAEKGGDVLRRLAPLVENGLVTLPFFQPPRGAARGTVFPGLPVGSTAPPGSILSPFTI